jgi:hypothetical protein
VGGVDVVLYSSSVRSLFPVFFLRERLSEVQDADAFLVAAVHRGTELCWLAPVLVTPQRETFTPRILLGDMPDALSVSRVPYRHWSLFASSARRRRADTKKPEERHPLEIVSLRSLQPGGAMRTERLLRCSMTAYRAVDAVCEIPFFTFRMDADDACARPIPEVRLWSKWAHWHAAPRRNAEVEKLLWRKTTQRVYSLLMVVLFWIIASCGNGASP